MRPGRNYGPGRVNHARYPNIALVSQQRDLVQIDAELCHFFAFEGGIPNYITAEGPVKYDQLRKTACRGTRDPAKKKYTPFIFCLN
jgi:hypothetical protein